MCLSARTGNPETGPNQQCFVYNGVNHFPRGCLARQDTYSGRSQKSAARTSKYGVRCYRSGVLYHIASACTGNNRGEEALAPASSGQTMKEALPVAEVWLDGNRHKVLVNTGCSRCVAHVSCCKKWRKEDVAILTISGEEQRCEGTGVVSLGLDNGASVDMGDKPLGFPFVLGMNGVTALGRVSVNAHRQVRFGVEDALVCAAAGTTTDVRVDEQDFSVTYDAASNTWTAAWKWLGGDEPGVNKVEEYTVPSEIRSQYEEEVEKWIEDGWLVPHDKYKHSPAKGLIPLMAVVQHNKGKVRPVQGAEHPHRHLHCRFRRLRRQNKRVAEARYECVCYRSEEYLQIHIHESLWLYETIMYKGRRHCLTRLGFGLNVASLIMKTVLNSLLSQDPNVKRGLSAYIDDVYVNEDVVTASRVVEYLHGYGLTTKAYERVTEGARVLGLRV